MNEQKSEEVVSGFHGIDPNSPKMAMVVKVSNPKLVKRSKYKKPTYLCRRDRLAFVRL